MFSQDDLLAEIDVDSFQYEYTIATFKGSKIVNFESAKLVAKKELTFVLSHKFANIENGINSSFGLDDVVTRLNFIGGL